MLICRCEQPQSFPVGRWQAALCLSGIYRSGGVGICTQEDLIPLFALPCCPHRFCPEGWASESLLSVSREDAAAQRGSDLPQRARLTPLSVASASRPPGQHCAPLWPTMMGHRPATGTGNRKEFMSSLCGSDSGTYCGDGSFKGLRVGMVGGCWRQVTL